VYELVFFYQLQLEGTNEMTNGCKFSAQYTCPSLFLLFFTCFAIIHYSERTGDGSFIKWDVCSAWVMLLSPVKVFLYILVL
jgi:hypothetical protein